MNLQTYLRDIRKDGKRSFTIEDILKTFDVPRGNARVALHRLMRSGDIVSPARGFYVIVPPEYQAYGCIPAEQLVPLLMSYLHAEYYVALLSAGIFYGASHQKPGAFQVISNRRFKKPISLGDVKIDFIYKKDLVDLPIHNKSVDTGYLRIASPELVAIDLLQYPSHAGGVNHIATVFSELVEDLNLQSLIELAIQTDSIYQLQRIGYILEKIDTMEETNKESIILGLTEFLAINAKSYIPIAPEVKIKGSKRSKKWKIIENADIESDL